MSKILQSLRIKPATNRLLTPVLVFFWPVVALFPYFFTFHGSYLAIGSDFIECYYNYKLYLLSELVNYRIPLWSPAEAAGFPFYSSPLTQTFYAFNLLLALFYRLAGGFSVLDYQRFTILGISIFALGLFFWLKTFRLNSRAVLLVVLITSIGYKMTELIRFPNAVHTAAWMPWILFAVNKIFFSRSTKEAIKYGVLLFFFFIFFLTGGYPYFVYFSIFLFFPYLLIFVLPRLCTNFFGTISIEWKRSLFTLTVSALAALITCAPYLYKMTELILQTTNRAGSSFLFSTNHTFNWQDTLGSLVFPPTAYFEGCYYFGMMGVFLILAYYVSRWYGFGQKNLSKPAETANTDSPWYLDFSIRLFFLAWIVLISLLTYGRNSVLFILLWRYMPFFANMRDWGRLNIVMLPLFAWLMAIAYQNFEDLFWGSKLVARSAKRRFVAKLGGIFGLVLFIQVYLLQYGIYDERWPYNLDRLHRTVTLITDMLGEKLSIGLKTLSTGLGLGIIGIGFILFALLAVAALRATGRETPATGMSRLVFSALVLFSVIDVSTIGPWLWVKGTSTDQSRTLLNVSAMNDTSFKYPREDTNNTSLLLGPAFGVGMMANWDFERFVEFRAWAKNEPQATKQLLGEQDGQRLYFSQHIDYPTIQSYLDDAFQFTGHIQVIGYWGSRLELQVTTPKDGYLGFIDNWEPDWQVSVDGQPEQIELLFKTFKAVFLSAGSHRMVFNYQPSWPILGR